MHRTEKNSPVPSRVAPVKSTMGVFLSAVTQTSARMPPTIVEKVAEVGQCCNHSELSGLTASHAEKEASGKHASVGIGQSTTHLAY